MSDKYRIFKGDDPYFVTFTIVDWLKVLSDDSYKMVLIESIIYCQKNKGLNLYGYCIMPNHVHMIIQATGAFSISDILRDLKKFTSKAIVSKLEEEKPNGYKEYLNSFLEAGKPLKRIKTFKVWQDGNQAKLIFSNRFLLEKLAYIHNNPVEYGLCEVPWTYKYSSATNYAGMNSILDVILLSL